MLFATRASVLRQAQCYLRSSTRQKRSTFARLLGSLAVLEQREGKLQHGSLCAVTAAQKLGGSVTGFIAGSGVRGVAEEAAKVKGIDKVIMIENGSYDKGLPENYAPLLVENIKKENFTHVFAGHSAFGKNLMPRVAAVLDVQQISDVTAIESEDTFVRPIYAGNAILTVQSSDKIKIITIRGTAFAAAEAEGGSADIVEGVDPKVEIKTEWISEDLAKSDRPDLGTASKVVSGGRGLKSKEQFDKIIPPLADVLGAAIGASRAAVDSGFADNSLQVGQTGKNVAPQLYLCAGISGAIQHLAGMKDSKVIAAINKDADAPIFQVADVGLVETDLIPPGRFQPDLEFKYLSDEDDADIKSYVGDLFDKVPELTEKLKQQ